MDEFSSGKMWDEYDKAIGRLRDLDKEIDMLKSLIRGMALMWFAAMSYAEHGKQKQYQAMQNYYNRDNPLTQAELSLLFSLMPESEG